MSTPSGLESAFQRAAALIQAGRQAEAQPIVAQILTYTAKLIERGERQQAGRHLIRVLKTLDARNGTAWLQMADVVESVEKKREALQRVPTEDPAYPAAQQALRTLAGQADDLDELFGAGPARPVTPVEPPVLGMAAPAKAHPQRISPRGRAVGVVLMLAVIALLIGVGLLANNAQTAGPDQVVQRFFKAAQAGDDTALNDLMTAQFKALLTLFTTDFGKASAKTYAGITQSSVLTTSVGTDPDNTAIVILKLQGRFNGQDGDFCERYDLLKVDGGWRIGQVRGLNTCDTRLALSASGNLAATPVGIVLQPSLTVVQPTLDAAGLAVAQTSTSLAQTRQAMRLAPTLTATYLAPAFTQTALVAEQNRLNTAIAATQTAVANRTQESESATRFFQDDADTQTAIAQTQVAQTRVALTATQASRAFITTLHGRIAFIMAHKIYVLSLPDQKITQLSDDATRIERAVWSPDGKTLAYEAKNQIFVMAADSAKAISLTGTFKSDARAPAWSPTGQQIAFAGGSISQIWVMAADGANPIKLTNDKNTNSSPAWSPDGKSIAYTSHVPFGDTQIFVIDTDGKNSHALTTGINPAWSPDGKSLVYEAGERVGDQGIFRIDADGSNRRRLTDAKFQSAVPAWSPDGQVIVFASHRSQGWQLYAMAANGAFVFQLTTDVDNLSTLSWTR